MTCFLAKTNLYSGDNAWSRFLVLDGENPLEKAQETFGSHIEEIKPLPAEYREQGLKNIIFFLDSLLLTVQYGVSRSKEYQPTTKEINMETIITANQAKDLIIKTGGNIFSTQFIKKDKSIRTMSCRLHVKKHLIHKGIVASTTAHIDKYITVFEMKGEASPAYRNINIETMLTLKVGGKQYVVAHDCIV